MDLDNNKNTDIYVDQINIFTLIIILFKVGRKKIHRIFYDNYYLPKFLDFVWKKIKLKNINEIPVSRFKLENKFFYSFHWEKIDEFLKTSFSEDRVFEENSKFLKKNRIDLNKYSRHLRDQSVIHSYLPIKLVLFSKKFSRQKKTIFIMSNNPLKIYLENFFKIKINNYVNLFYHTLKLESGWSKNPQYIAYHINFISPKLFKLKKITFFLLVCLRGILIKNKSNKSKKICIELHQREIKLNEITDFYWAKYSKIKKENIVTFSYKKWDKDSLNVLKDFGIINNYDAYKAPIFLKDFIKIIFLTPKLYFNLIRYNSYDGWKKFNRVFFISKLKYYNSLYQTFNINFLFSMADFDEDKFIKLQAIKNNDGLSSFSHWSNFNVKQIIYHKCCDIFFTWSKHFTETFFNEYPYQKVYYVGYPNDHLFKNIENLQKKENYIIGYMDNIINNDLPYHISHIKSVFRMFFELLEKYPNLLIYTKPKTKYYYQKLIESFAEMKKFVDQDRIVSFFGESYNVKMSPAKFSSRCNLVLSQGISSAGAEVGFYGIKSFHYDNMELENYNGFSKIGQNKIIFKNINTLKKVFEKEIENPNNNNDESKKCHSILNPFKENRCGERTALIIDTIYQNFDGLNNLNKTLKIVNDVIEKNYNLFKNDQDYKY